MKKEKEKTERNGVDAIIEDVQYVRSKSPQSAYQIINDFQPILDPFRIKLIDEYFSVVAEIEKGKKPLSERKRQERQDYLKRLLTPLVKLNRLHPQGENPYLKHDGTYPFIEEKFWVDKEIDINKLHYDKQKYYINFEYSKPLNYFDPDAKNITIRNEYRVYVANKEEKEKARKEYIEKLKRQGKRIPASLYYSPLTPLDAGKTSIRELYKKWLPTLTQDIMKNKDLLDQILVIYTIKRALNGDEKAIEKLYSLYEDTAIGIAVITAKKRKLNKDDINVIKQEAKTCLSFLISGFRPEDIMNGIELPLQIEKFYCWYLSEYVPKELDKILKREPYKLDGVEIDYLLNTISIMDAYTSWQNTPKRVVKFNSYSFRPTKGKYLTIWLFGKGKGDMNSKLRQLISKSIDDYWKMKKEIPHELIEEKRFEL